MSYYEPDPYSGDLWWDLAAKTVAALICVVALFLIIVLTLGAMPAGSIESVVAIEHVTTEAEKADVVTACFDKCVIGSGVVTTDGYIVTAAHVVKDEHKVGDSVFFLDAKGVEHAAVVRLIDPVQDIAILSTLNGYHGDRSALLCNPGSYYVGEKIIVRGAPLFLGITTTYGSLVRGEWSPGIGANSASATWPTSILFDAVVSYGNSGGPIYDYDGRVIGIVVGMVAAGYNTASNYNVAVPARIACDAIDKLKSA